MGLVYQLLVACWGEGDQNLFCSHPISNPQLNNNGQLSREGILAGSGMRTLHEDGGQQPFTGRALEGAVVFLHHFLRLLEEPTADKRWIRAFRDGYQHPE